MTWASTICPRRGILPQNETATHHAALYLQVRILLVRVALIFFVALTTYLKKILIVLADSGTNNE